MILIDTREGRSPVPKMLNSFKIDTKIQQLEIGDYVIIGPTLSVCGSRKTAQDYIGSINSNHLSNELYQMSQAYEYCFLAINGSIEEALIYRKMKRASYFEYLSSCYLKRSKDGLSSPISVFQFTTDYDFVCFLKTLHDNIMENDVYRELDIELPKKKNLTTYEQKVLSCTTFPNIGRGRAKLILKNFPSLKKLINAKEEDFKKIKGLGRKISQNLIEYFNNKEVKE